MVRAIVGANWGDEGKGKITDVLAKDADVVIRFQGGSNAGHTIINEYGRFALHQLPSGVFYHHTTNIIGNGVALNVPAFLKELKSLEDGGVPALAEVKFSVTHNRGCFGGCSFCSIAYHQGRQVRARSIESVVEEVRALSALPDFKGYIHDVGGPTANFRRPSCTYQQTHGVCKTRHCLAPSPCKNLIADHSEYLRLLRAVEAVPGVKKVFIRSGLRFDYMLCDQSESGKAFFKKLVRDHVSGQLRVAPEHCSDAVLACMGKPPVRVFERFRAQYYALCEAAGLKQYLVPYLMSSHPGSTLADAVSLAQHIKKWGCDPEQVQDFYPTPGTASTVMFYTGIDPFTGKEVFVPKSREEKQLQRALLQPHNPKNQPLVRKALHLCGREDLIG